MKNIKLFFWVILVQIFILNNIQLSGYINPYYYIIFILSIPNKTSKSIHLLLSFFVGFIIDFFSNSYGIHAFSSVLIAYCKIIWISKTTENKDGEEGYEINNLSISRFIKIAFYFIFIHHFSLFFLERSSLSDFFSIFQTTLFSSFFTMILLVIHKLFTIKKNEKI